MTSFRIKKKLARLVVSEKHIFYFMLGSKRSDITLISIFMIKWGPEKFRFAKVTQLIN